MLKKNQSLGKVFLVLYNSVWSLRFGTGYYTMVLNFSTLQFSTAIKFSTIHFSTVLKTLSLCSLFLGKAVIRFFVIKLRISSN